MKLYYGNEQIDIRRRLPVLPLRDTVIFPHIIYPLMVGRQFTISAMQQALVSDKQIFLCTQKNPEIEIPTRDDVHDIGVVARILQVMKLPNGTMKVLVEGLIRGRIKSFRKTRGVFFTGLDLIAPDEQGGKEIEAISRSVIELFTEYVRLNRRIPDEMLLSISSIDNYQRLTDTIASNILQKTAVKQQILELETIKAQLKKVSGVLRSEIEILRIEQRIEGTVREALSKDQKEFYLQKQLKAIKDELGQHEESTNEVADLLDKLKKMKAPKDVITKTEDEINKLSKMHPYSAESAVVRGYIEWILTLPWDNKTEDRSDFKEVESILDGDHYGLDKPKKRILEHLAVLRIARKVKGPILCFVGPPGVGKTSLGRSIARALNRNFVRMSLGGIHDEAEIRGHRRTYIGSMPGRILQSLKKAGSSNPVFLLDEVDKIGTDFRGDPAAALLEVLDPEQNVAFSDNYLELDFDLSKVLFITTANSLSGIPPALDDRMETIRLPGYLEYEKIKIVRGYLLPRLINEMGLGGITIDIDDKALVFIIRNYTRESGVREIERQLASILRKIAQIIAKGLKHKKFKIGINKIKEYLGAPQYISTDIKTIPPPGYAVGLAWTEAGGEVLPVEVSLMKGSAKLTLTGKLGEVMRESASAGLSYIRSRAEKFALKPDFYDNMEIHIHVPEGAVPKDGPSAGITILLALLSALIKKPIRPGIAFTGEITLSGDILPIGGLNEKLLAAKRSGITDVVIPFKNKKDIPELPKDLIKDMNLIPVKSAGEVIKIAFSKAAKLKKVGSK